MTKISRAPVALCWLFEWILWLVFTDNTGYRELLAGAAAAAVATYFSFSLAARRPGHGFRVSSGMAVIWHLPAALAHDTGVLLFALGLRLTGKRLPSGIVGIPFGAVANSPVARGKRALATTLMTITPNTLVLGVLKEKQILFYHRLLPQPPSTLVRQLSEGAGRSS
ncbi:MAG: Na+/H+ antiporter subunit E [Candidatus Acidiferrales bacterium]